MRSFLDLLEQFEEGFKNAPIKDPQVFDDLREGKYTVRINGIWMEENQFTGSPQIRWELVILEGPQAGRKLNKYSKIETQENANWIKQDFYNCGVEIESLRDLESAFNSLLDRKILITVKKKIGSTGKEHNNVYINKEVVSFL
jgi:hypothetical protein